MEQQEGNRTVKVRNIVAVPANTAAIHYHDSNPIIVLSNYIAGTHRVSTSGYIYISKGEIT